MTGVWAGSEVLLIRDDDEVVYGDSGYSGMEKCPEVQSNEHLSDIEYRINVRPSSIKISKDYNGRNWDKEIESRKSSTRCKVEHAFLIVKRQFGYSKVVYRGIAKNLHRFNVLFACANIVMCARAGRMEEFCFVIASMIRSLLSIEPLLSGCGIHKDITCLLHRTAPGTILVLRSGKPAAKFRDKSILLCYCCKSLVIQCFKVCITMKRSGSICFCPLACRNNITCSRIDAADQLAMGTRLFQLFVPIGNRLIDICYITICVTITENYGIVGGSEQLRDSFVHSAPIKSRGQDTTWSLEGITSRCNTEKQTGLSLDS